MTRAVPGLTSSPMIWDNAEFRKAYRERLRSVEAGGEAEARAQAMAFQAEAAKWGGSNGEHFARRAGAAAATMLSGYVRGAIEAFDQALLAVQAELEDADLNGLRTSLEQEIARRAKSLPAALRDFTKPPAPPALLRAILQQAPVNARQLLAESVSAARDRVRTRARARELPDRAIFISHDPRDAALAEALKLAIQAAIGDDVVLCTSSDLESMRTGPGGSERVLAQLKKNRMTLSLVTPHSIGDPSFWWALGVTEGAGKPALALRTAGVSLDVALPLRPEQDIPLAQREDVARVLQAVQTELRRRGKDFSDLDFEDLFREAAHYGLAAPRDARRIDAAPVTARAVPSQARP